MAGITAFGAYVPIHRLDKLQIRGGPGERAVAGHDEDSVTMAVAAALDCLGGQDGPQRPELVYFASTTATYREKQAAAVLAGALDLPVATRSADFSDSLRAGAAAMLAALDAVQGGSVGRALVAVADCRLGAPGGGNEANFGDAAAAFVLGRDEVLAEVRATHSVTADFTGNWREPGDRFVQNWEERFVVGEGYVPLVSAAVQGLLRKAGLMPADCARLVLYGPSARHHAALARRLGFSEAQIQDPLFGSVGCAGAAHAPLQLVAALEQAAPGERILFVSFGEGADAILFEVTEAIRRFRPQRGAAWHVARRRPLAYARYMQWRSLGPVEASRRPARERPSLPAAWRGRRKNLGFVGVRCTACGTPQFPPQHICVRCQTRDAFEEYRFAGRTARIATFTADHLAVSADPPNLIAFADFDGGGRILTYVTDCEVKELRIGLELEMTFRHLYDAGGLHVYFWKARPKA